MGLEPTTFCMASRCSSQLSYIRVGADYSRVSGSLARGAGVVWRGRACSDAAAPPAPPPR
jgi:transposase